MQHVYPPVGDAYAAGTGLSYELNNRRIDAAKRQGTVTDVAPIPGT
jgi:hypothetical protein